VGKIKIAMEVNINRNFHQEIKPGPNGWWGNPVALLVEAKVHAGKARVYRYSKQSETCPYGVVITKKWSG